MLDEPTSPVICALTHGPISSSGLLASTLLNCTSPLTARAHGMCQVENNLVYSPTAMIDTCGRISSTKGKYGVTKLVEAVSLRVIMTTVCASRFHAKG